MDAVLLSRIQFGVTAGFHFIFPPLTFGLTLIILIIETLSVKSGEEIYQKISSFLIKILGLVFVMGVATGIVLEFSFGTNWSTYSRMVGDIFGAPLAAEGIFAFFLESVFLGVLIFGRKKVSKRVFWLSAFLVFFASHLSGLWIIVANSWMQTPAGFEKVIVDGTLQKIKLTDFTAALLNGSTVVRYIHVVFAGWITGSLFAAAIAAWYLIKKRHEDTARHILKVALIVFICSSLLQLGSGHAHSVQVAKTQPEKMAAFEALWNTTTGAPLAIFGIPVESEQKTYLEISIPKMLSLLIDFNPDSKVQGLNDFPENERPPVFLPYMSYHTMIGLGMLFIGVSILGIILLVTGKLYTATWYLAGLLILAPLPHIANLTGWIAAEVGRQPWVVYKILRTADAASVVVPAWQILFSLIMFSAIYLLLFVMFIFLLVKFVKAGPEEARDGGY
ncbi:MAG TPA: cytochrome ubiquinol oxidase subunit I [Spirochaetota bacterium]|nr:cytochrome ubiquinol oxidase subunit I [Spirochaetota bacterium]